MCCPLQLSLACGMCGQVVDSACCTYGQPTYDDTNPWYMPIDGLPDEEYWRVPTCSDGPCQGERNGKSYTIPEGQPSPDPESCCEMPNPNSGRQSTGLRAYYNPPAGTPVIPGNFNSSWALRLVNDRNEDYSDLDPLNPIPGTGGTCVASKPRAICRIDSAVCSNFVSVHDCRSAYYVEGSGFSPLVCITDSTCS